MAIDSSILIRLQKTRQNTAGFFMIYRQNPFPVSCLFLCNEFEEFRQFLETKKTREITAEFDFLIFLDSFF